MSVLLSREEGSKSSPVLRRSSSKLKPDPEDYLNEESSAKEQDQVRIVAGFSKSDRSSRVNNLQSAEVDSDAEKFSPLLSSKKAAADLADEANAIEREPSEKEKKLMMAAGGDRGGDDSDYYTPEDPAPTILSPLYESDKVGFPF